MPSPRPGLNGALRRGGSGSGRRKQAPKKVLKFLFYKSETSSKAIKLAEKMYFWEL